MVAAHPCQTLLHIHQVTLRNVTFIRTLHTECVRTMCFRKYLRRNSNNMRKLDGWDIQQLVTLVIKSRKKHSVCVGGGDRNVYGTVLLENFRLMVIKR